MAVITVWSGREADALREALRMSIDDFALYLGVSRRAVARWREAGQDIRLRWDMQRVLDSALTRCPLDAKARMQSLLTADSAAPAAHSAVSARLRAVTATATAASQAGGGETGVAGVLSDVLIWPPSPTGAHPDALLNLERMVARLRMAYQAAAYTHVASQLATLMQALAEAQAHATARFPLRVRRLAAAAHHVTAGLLLKLGDVPMAMLAAERSGQEAAASGDPLVVAAAARIGARVLLCGGHAERAAAVAVQAARAVKLATALDGPRPLSAYGALLLCGAAASASAGDDVGTFGLLRDASVAAQQLGFDGNFGWTAFGPANVAIHEVSARLALGDPAGALRVALAADVSGLHQAERLVALHVDIATAWHRLGRTAAAVLALERAQAIAPEEVRLRPSTRELAADLAAARISG